MIDLWTALTPLIVGSAIVPIQIIVTILLLRSESGRLTAVAFVAGMTLVRLAQGAVFGLVLSSSDTVDNSDDGARVVVSIVLLVAGILLLAAGVRQVLAEDDPDEPPPKWMTMTGTATPGKAMLIGFGYLAVAPKFWVFTLGAIAAIGEADLGQPSATLTFLLFVVLAESVHLAVVGIALVMPHQSRVLLDRTATWLGEHNRLIVIVLAAVFGTWFVLKGLNGLGVI